MSVLKKVRTSTALAAMAAASVLPGCSLLNPADSADYACPGMPMGVTCKTPAAVYKSTNGELAQTEFDTPIGGVAGKTNTSSSGQLADAAARTTSGKAAVVPGPKPVREPAKVARIWIAPWIDKSDNLHLAQTIYTEIKPRTWTVGKPEVAASAGYVIPHKAFNAIGGDKPSNAKKPDSGSPAQAEELVQPE